MRKRIGEQLDSFPQSAVACIVFELGNVGSYLMLEAYCYDVQGHAALRIVMANNEEAPCGERLEFSIVAEAASLNTLGRLLMNWQTENDTEITWQAQVS